MKHGCFSMTWTRNVSQMPGWVQVRCGQPKFTSWNRKLRQCWLLSTTQGIVHKEFSPLSAMMNGAYYLGVMDRVCKQIRRLRSKLWESKDFFLLHDNAPVYTVGVVFQFLTQKQVAVLHYPSYSPDLSPCDYFLFPKLKTRLESDPIWQYSSHPRSSDTWIKQHQMQRLL